MFNVLKHNSYKIGMNEIEGMEKVLRDALEPVRQEFADRIYWGSVGIESTEYKSRDGFIPHSHNCGGVQIMEIIPECESLDWGFLEFGECDGECPPDAGCQCDDEGHLSAKVRVWLKYEGQDVDGSHAFYLYMGGGNGDAPYFRTSYESTLFARTFKANDLQSLEREASAVVAELLKFIAK